MTIDPLRIEFAITVISSCRKNWITTGNCKSTKQEVKDHLLERIKLDQGLANSVSWSNLSSVNNDTRVKLDKLAKDFETILAQLVTEGLVSVSGDEVNCLIDFKLLVGSVLTKETIDTSSADFRGILKGSTDFLMTVLKQAQLISEDGKSAIAKKMAKDVILDEVLTYIEQKDALQIRYGLYDSSMSSSDVIANKSFPNDPFFVKTEFGLRMLMSEKFLLPLNVDDDILKWIFRSRIAEITRLITKLRQRFEKHKSYRNSPQLTRGVKLEIVDRKFPVRTIDVSTSIENARNYVSRSPIWNEYSSSWDEMASILSDSLKSRKLSVLNNFQDRCFNRVFTHLSDPQSKQEGLVITAGTGMGKTLSYIGPLLLYLMLEKSARQTIGTKAICIYPRIKLAENQIEGFVKTIYEINQSLDPSSPKITIGIDYTGTPYHRKSFLSDPEKGSLREGKTNRLWKYSQENDAYICPYAKCPTCGQPLYIQRKSDFSKKVPLKCLNNQCHTVVNFIIYCKDDIGSDPPDILIITTESLTRRLSNSKFQGIFGTENFCAPKLVMVDEVHMHTSINGSQVGYLLRRLLQRISYGLQVSKYSQGEPIVLGLSATIGQPEEFFSDLTGIPKYLIGTEHPLEDEFEKSGVEYFLFVKPETSENVAVISNLIQTSMCVLHNAIQHEKYPQSTNKALGFVDSLDLVKRWSHDLKDAETEQRLYELRDPNRIASDTDVREYFGLTTTNCSGCAHAVNTNCVHFQEGECWWFMRFGHAQTEPLNVTYKTGGEGEVPSNFDLVVTTSAMEVGYDDPDIMCILQYQSPMNAASFTQRKGRAGRGVRNRPISVVVLSPYRTKDVYTYRNHHMLIEPSFEKLPLNPENKAVRKIHGFYALLDLLAFEERNSNYELSEYISPQNAAKLEEFARRNRDTERYLKQLFNYKVDDKEIADIKTVLRDLINRIKNSNYAQLVNKILNEHLPENLFSSINLPTAKVYEYNVYNGEQPWSKGWHCSVSPKEPAGFLKIAEKGKCPESYMCHNKYPCKPHLLDGNLDINMAISEASIANVTYRWGRSAFWIPPYNQEQLNTGPLKQMDIHYNWIVTPDHQTKNISAIPGKNVPKTLRGLVPKVQNGTQEKLLVIRPDIIRETKFLTEGTKDSHWIYCFDHDGVYAGLSHYQKNHQTGDTANHRYNTISPKTTSYPFTFYDITFNQNGMLKDSQGIIKSVDLDSDFEKGRLFGVFDRLFNQIYFANKDTGEHINVKKSVVGAACSIITPLEKVESVFGYVSEEQDVSLGYDMVTDGINLWIGSWLKGENVERDCPEIFNTLKSNFFKFEVLKENKKPGGRNSYAVNAFLNVYLAMLADKKADISKIESYLAASCKDTVLQGVFRGVADKFFTFNSRTKKAIDELLGDNDFISIVFEKHKAILEANDKKLIYDYTIDTFHHSLKHALKSAFVVLGGFQSERDVGGWTYLNFDSDFQKQIYIFENGMYGTGAFRSIYNKYVNNPQKIWNIIEEYLVSCPTSDEEDFLNKILELDDCNLEMLNSYMGEITQSKKFSERKAAIDKTLQAFRKNYQMELKDEHIKALTRLFAKPLELQNTVIENWRLYKELNEAFYNSFRTKYNRDLTSEEVQQLFFNSLTAKNSEIKLPAWIAFFEVLQSKTKNRLEMYLRKVQYDISKIPGLSVFLSKTSQKELEHIYTLSQQEQVDQINNALGNKQKSAKKIANILFAEMDEVPVYKYYFFKVGSPEFPLKQLEASLAKQSLREEIEKRLLNTCIDACPSCLQTSCEIDFELRSRLLLSRRLLKYAVSRLKQPFIVHSDSNSDYMKFKDAVSKILTDKYQVLIQYPLNQSSDVARVVSELLNTIVEKDGKKYQVIVNSSGYSSFSFKNRKIIYETNLRCDEVLQ